MASGAETAHGVRPRWILWISIGIAVLGRASQNIALTTYPLLAHEHLHVSNARVGLMGTIVGLTSVLSATFMAGPVPARCSALVLMVSQLLLACTFVVLGASPGPPGMWAAIVVLGIGGGIFFPSAMTHLGSGPRDGRARALALFALALSLSLLVSPVVEAGVLRAVGGSLPRVFEALTVLPVLGALLALVLALRSGGSPCGIGLVAAQLLRRRPTRQGCEADRDDQPLAALEPPAARRIPRLRRAGVRGTPAAGRADQGAWRLALAAMLTYQVPFVAVVSFGGLLALHRAHADLAEVQVAFGAFYGSSLLVRLVVAHRAPLRHSARVLAVCAVLAAVGLWLAAAAQSVPQLLVAMFVLGIPHGATFPVSSGLLATNTPAEGLGRANGALMANSFAAAVVVPILCGELVGVVGYEGAFMSLEVPVVVSGAYVVLRAWRAWRAWSADGQDPSAAA